MNKTIKFIIFGGNRLKEDGPVISDINRTLSDVDQNIQRNSESGCKEKKG